MQFHLAMERLRFMVADRPEARLEFETGKAKVTDAGVPVFRVRLLAMDGETSAPILVSVDGDPGLEQGVFVRPVGLVLHVVERKGESIMWWRAERLEPGATPAAGGGRAAAGKAAAS